MMLYKSAILVVNQFDEVRQPFCTYLSPEISCVVFFSPIALDVVRVGGYCTTGEQRIQSLQGKVILIKCVALFDQGKIGRLRDKPEVIELRRDDCDAKLLEAKITITWYIKINRIS